MNWLVGVVAVLLVGCIPPPVYRVQRTARVPHAAAPLRTGEALAGPVELSFGGSYTSAAKLGSEDASVEVPTAQSRGELRIRLPRRGEIALFTERAFESTIYPIDDTQAPVPEGTPWNVGAAIRYAAAIDDAPNLTIGLGFEVMRWSIPYVEYRTCVEYCDGQPLTEMHTGEEMVASPAFSFSPTYRAGAFALFTSLYGRRQPTIVRKGTEIGPNYETDVDAGPLNMVLAAGAEYRFGHVSALVSIYGELTQQPVVFGPSVAFALAATLPEQ